jgi:hypothetical protein
MEKIIPRLRKTMFYQKQTAKITVNIKKRAETESAGVTGTFCFC